MAVRRVLSADWMFRMPDPDPAEPQPERQPTTSPAMRPLYFVAGILLLGVGIAGYILPVMPGTIFLILAAACFARSSARLESWLLNHPKLGPAVVAWRRHGAIPRKAKVVALTAMTISFVLVVMAHPPVAALWATGLLLLGSALFVATRPGV